MQHISCGPSLRLKSTKQILMTYEEREGIVGLYSSGLKLTLKAKKHQWRLQSPLQCFASDKNILRKGLSVCYGQTLSRVVMQFDRS